MPLVQRETAHGPIYIGEIPDDFLRVPQAANQQIASDELTAHMMAGRSMGLGYGGVQPPNVRGKLSISIAQAKLTKNYAITKMDPYCRLRIGHAVFETPTASSAGKNPRWNKTIQCFLPLGVDHVYVEIYDEKTFQSDDRIAWAHVPIPDRALTGETCDEWINLSGKQGDDKEGMMNLVFSFSMAEAPTVIAQPPMMAPQVVMMPGAPGMFYPQYAQQYQPVMQGVPPNNVAAPVRQPQPVQPLSEDELNQIKDMFPNVDMTVIKSVAEANRSNKDATINALLSMAD